MNNPFRRRPAERGPTAHDPIEDALRASLAARARQAPSDDGLVERIVAAAETAPPRRDPGPGLATPHRGWRSAALPLVAAAVVALVVGGVVAVENYHRDPGRPAGENSAPPPPATATVPAPLPASTFAGPSTPAASPTATSALRNVQVVDLTFVGPDDGWALASADCVSGSGRCTALLRTLDGNQWTSLPGAAFNVPGVKGCAAPCVTHLRFANDGVGYAYGPDALFLTGNGGRSWQQQKGLGADALETAAQNVILVRAVDTASPTFARSDIGSSTWTSIPIPDGAFPAGAKAVTLARTGSTAVLELTRYDPAAGSGLQPATFYRSTDAGTKWTTSADPCSSAKPAATTVGVAATTAPDGSVVLGCVSGTTRSTATSVTTITSTNAGRTFVAPSHSVGLAPPILLAAASAQVQLAMTADGKGDQLVRSGNGGASWSAVSQIPIGSAVFLGFENDEVGRLVTAGGTEIWTTRDAGVSWTKASL